jgi:small subunit ribosomal protein S17
MKKTITGIVKHYSGDQTCRIAYILNRVNKKYKKNIIYKKHQIAHNKNNEAKIGNTVIIEECRPISKIKSFYIKKIIK